MKRAILSKLTSLWPTTFYLLTAFTNQMVCAILKFTLNLTRIFTSENCLMVPFTSKDL